MARLRLIGASLWTDGAGSKYVWRRFHSFAPKSEIRNPSPLDSQIVRFRMETKEEIESKLTLYKSQLDQVNQLLSIDSSNTQFLTLKDDLDKVITLTEALLVQAYHNNKDEDIITNNASDDDKYSLGDLDDDDDSACSTLRVKDRVEVTGGAHPFPAVITGIINETEFKVKYFAYDAEVSLPLSCLQRLSGSGGYRAGDVAVGMKCQCKYAVDQQYYDASIVSKTDYGYVVSYSEYGNSEEVPLEYLRPILAPAQQDQEGQQVDGKGAAGKKRKDKGEESKLIPIPAKLNILPTDTEEEKQRKKKKVKAIKFKNRIIEQESEVAQVAHTWQKFSTKKSTKRAFTGLAKSGSMFASSEDANSKVGVVNSGKGMTSFIERKKHKFES